MIRVWKMFGKTLIAALAVWPRLRPAVSVCVPCLQFRHQKVVHHFNVRGPVERLNEVSSSVDWGHAFGMSNVCNVVFDSFHSFFTQVFFNIRPNKKVPITITDTGLNPAAS